MINIWIKLVSDQYKLALDLTRVVFGLGGRQASVSVQPGPATPMVPDQPEAPAAGPRDDSGQETGREEQRFATVAHEAEIKSFLPGAAQISGSGAGKIPRRQIESKTGSARAKASTIAGIMAFLESANQGATVREIAEHLEMDKKSILPLLKTLVKERRLDELLGRYCVLKS